MRIISLFLVIVMVFLTFSCANSEVLDYPVGDEVQEFEFKTYGLFNKNEKNENIRYELSIGNIIWSVLLIETIFVPVILIGWYLYEPVEYIGDSELPIGAVPVGAK